MNKWLARFKQNPSQDTDSPDTMHAMSIMSVPAIPVSHKSASTASTVSVSDAPDFEKYRELYHERAAIMQHDSGWSSDEANLWGLREAVYAWAHDHHPHIISHIITPPEAH
jgi:hypothetical protein